jgi:hypothetical protein
MVPKVNDAIKTNTGIPPFNPAATTLSKKLCGGAFDSFNGESLLLSFLARGGSLNLQKIHSSHPRLGLIQHPPLKHRKALLHIVLPLDHEQLAPQ